ncbi:MAG: hypothetical protein IJG07_05580 [Prevotella sp.]|nr:hypothetical protein [Prevotella sp.]
MQQLTLQFDGFAQEQQRVDVVAPARKTVRVMNQAAARVKSVASELSVRAQRTVSPWRADWMAWAYRRTMRSQFLSVIGVPLLFTPAALYGWAAVLGLLMACGVAEWLQGGAL